MRAEHHIGAARKPLAAARLMVAFVLLGCLAAVPCAARRVITTDGGVLEVDSYEVEGDWVRLRLSGSGEMLMPLAKIERMFDNTPVDQAAGAQLLSRPFDLRFGGSDARLETPFADLIFETARRHGVSVRLVTAMIQVESNFDPRALSHKGARGLLQLMPATAERFGVSAERLFEPAENLEAGLRYLKFLLTRFPNDLPRVLAAYNAGESQVERYDGVPPFRETRDYVRKVLERLGKI